MKKSRAALEGAGRALGMPLEYAAGLPRVELDGFSRVRIESHRGVQEYGRELIELSARGAGIRVSGKGLGLRCLTAELAVIEGRIKSVEFIYGEDGE